MSLFGEGSSLAVKGAHTLAAALESNVDDDRAAFAAYETAYRKLVMPGQPGMRAVSHLLIPSTRLGIATRNLATGIAGPLTSRRAG